MKLDVPTLHRLSPLLDAALDLANIDLGEQISVGMTDRHWRAQLALALDNASS